MNTEKRYKIRARSEDDTEFKYLDYDERSGGYPYWSNYIDRSYISNDIIKITELSKKIAEEFQNGKGEYFHSKIDNSTLEIITIEITEVTSIEIKQKTEEDKAKSTFMNLTEEEKKTLAPFLNIELN